MLPLDGLKATFESLMASLDSGDKSSGLAIHKIMPQIDVLYQHAFTYEAINEKLESAGWEFETETVEQFHKEYLAKKYNRIGK
jgi:hypothetical protein